MDVSYILKKRTNNYRIEVPKNVLYVYRLDKLNVGKYWMKAIAKTNK